MNDALRPTVLFPKDASTEAEGEPCLLKIASYNIHLAIGRDSRYLPQRILDVLREIDADVIALQEVSLGAGGFDMLAYLAEEMGFESVAGPTLRHPVRGAYGNAILSRWPVHKAKRLNLSFKRCEPRGALDIELSCEQKRLRILATHLGLRPKERRTQIRSLLRAFEDDESMPTVLLGDLNEWFLWGRPSRWLRAYFKDTPSVPTFPAGWPILALDRIWARPRAMLTDLRVHCTPLAKIASDHLPVMGTVRL